MTTPTKLEKLINFVEYYATCPCCDGLTECVEECTFEDDCPHDYPVMTAAREALKDDE